MNKRIALLHMQSVDDEALWRAALASQNLPTASLPRNSTSIVDTIRQDVRMAEAGVLIVDEPLLTQQGIPASQLAARLNRSHSHLAVFLRLPYRPRISAQEQAWANACGLAGVLPGASFVYWRETLAPSLSRVLQSMDRGPAQVEKVVDFLRVLVDQRANATNELIERAFEVAERAARAGLDLPGIATRMRSGSGIAVQDRTFRRTTYRQCFVASEAVGWLTESEGLSRRSAVLAGQALQHFGAIHHVVREQEFADEFYFFRFGDSRRDREEIDLAEIATALRGKHGVEIADRTYLGKRFPACFTGADAVDWLIDR